MAMYAQFYINHAPGGGPGGESGTVVAGMGDRAVLRLDARERGKTHHELARDWIRRHEASQQFVAYRLFTGSILNPQYITPVLRADGTEIPSSTVHDYAAPAPVRPAPGRAAGPVTHGTASDRAGYEDARGSLGLLE